MWRELFSELLATQPSWTEPPYFFEFQAGVAIEALLEAERKLGFKIPLELAELWQEFDGYLEYVTTPKGEQLHVGSLIWSLAESVEWHLTLTVPTNSRLFCFGNSITGNCYGYLLENGKPLDSEIYQSDHETSPPEEFIVKRASNLREFITKGIAHSRYW